MSPYTEMAKEVYLSWCTIVLRDDRIVQITVQPGIVLDENAAQQLYRIIHELTNGEKSAVLVDARVDYEITREAKRIASENSGNRYGTAVLSDREIAATLINSYLAIFKPKSPVRHFTSEADAVSWLLELSTNKS